MINGNKKSINKNNNNICKIILTNNMKNKFNRNKMIYNMDCRLTSYNNINNNNYNKNNNNINNNNNNKFKYHSSRISNNNKKTNNKFNNRYNN